MEPEQVAELHQLRRRDGLPAEPVAADLGMGREGVLRQAVRKHPCGADALEPAALGDVHPARACQKLGIRRRRFRRRPEDAARTLAREPVEGEMPRVDGPDAWLRALGGRADVRLEPAIEGFSLTCQSACGPSPRYGGAGSRMRATLAAPVSSLAACPPGSTQSRTRRAASARRRPPSTSARVSRRPASASFSSTSTRRRTPRPGSGCARTGHRRTTCWTAYRSQRSRSPRPVANLDIVMAKSDLAAAAVDLSSRARRRALPRRCARRRRSTRTRTFSSTARRRSAR